MQIEFYLPLPSESFWAGLMIYYMAGLMLSLWVTLTMEANNTDFRLGFMDMVVLSVFWCPILAFAIGKYHFEHHRNQ